MKIKIIAVIFFCALIVYAQNKKTPPSMVGLTCKNCHTASVPTKDKPAVKPCPRQDMDVKDQPTGKGPELVKIDKLKHQTDVYTPVVFTHRLHAEMSGMSGGCKTCHHYNPQGQVIGCSECHEPTRKREDVSKPDLNGAYHRQCMDCHRQISGKTNCVECHKLNVSSQQPQTQNLMTAKDKKVHPVIVAPSSVKFDTPRAPGKMVSFFHEEHIKLFNLDCQNCHSNENCIKCHTANKMDSAKERTTEQKHAVCSSCHNTKENCTSCHANKPTAGFNHKEITGFDLSRFHSKLTCNRCHVEKGNFGLLKGECVNCHGTWTQENFQHKKTGVVLDEVHLTLSCTDCHQEKNYKNPVCTNCHDDKSYPKNIPGKMTGKTLSKK
jgi:hypothetical protein